MYAKAERERTHEVKAGDTVDSIARKHNVSVELLRAANPALDKQQTLTEGQKLALPAVNLSGAPAAAYDAQAAAKDPTSTMGVGQPKASGDVPPIREAESAKLKPLAQGDDGDGVAMLQEKLHARGFDAGDSGKFDAKTAAAVAKFNEENGIAAGERASEETVKALRAGEALFGKKARVESAGSVGGDVNIPKDAEAPFGRVDLATPAGQEVFRKAAKLAGVPEEWATSAGLRELVSHESGGIVGRPNYTYGERGQDPAQWKAIHDEIRAGQVNAESTATGLGQLLDENVDKYYPAGRKGIGDPVQEAAGMLNYIKERYGDPRIAWGNHSANPNRHQGVPVIYTAEGY